MLYEILMTLGFASLLACSIFYFCVSSRHAASSVMAIGYLLVLYVIDIISLWVRGT